MISGYKLFNIGEKCLEQFQEIFYRFLFFSYTKRFSFIIFQKTFVRYLRSHSNNRLLLFFSFFFFLSINEFPRWSFCCRFPQRYQLASIFGSYITPAKGRCLFFYLLNIFIHLGSIISSERWLEIPFDYRLFRSCASLSSSLTISKSSHDVAECGRKTLGKWRVIK